MRNERQNKRYIDGWIYVYKQRERTRRQWEVYIRTISIKETDSEIYHSRECKLVRNAGRIGDRQRAKRTDRESYRDRQERERQFTKLKEIYIERARNIYVYRERQIESYNELVIAVRRFAVVSNHIRHKTLQADYSK